MHEVFISYSSKDFSVAEAVRKRLESSAVSCWIAPRDARPGEEWTGEIYNAINRCKVFLLIYSQCSNESKEVLREISTASSADCTILPFRIDDSKMQGRLAYYLSSVHWLDASSVPLQQSLESLYHRISSLLSGETIPHLPPQTPKTTPSAPPRRRSILSKIRLPNTLLGWVVFSFLACVVLSLALDGIRTIREKILLHPVQTITTTTLPNSDNYRFPFRAFNLEKDQIVMEEKSTGKLFQVKLTNGSLVSHAFSNVFDDPASIDIFYPQGSDRIYFFEGNKAVYSLDKGNSQWVWEQGIPLGLQKGESISTVMWYVSFLANEAVPAYELTLFVSDENFLLSRILFITPEGTVTSTDISAYDLSNFICCFTNSSAALYINTEGLPFLLDHSTMQPVFVNQETLLRDYIPFRDSSCDCISTNGRYLLTKIYRPDYEQLIVLDLEIGSVVFDSNFSLGNTSAFFLSENSLGYFIYRDNKNWPVLMAYNLETRDSTILISGDDFQKPIFYHDNIFSFEFCEQLQAFFFLSCSYPKGKCVVKITMTDLNGKVIAQSGDIEVSDTGICSLKILDNMLVLSSVDKNDDTEKSLQTQFWRAFYHKKDGTIVFLEK